MCKTRGKVIWKFYFDIYILINLKKKTIYRNWSELRATLLEIVEAVIEELLQPEKNQLIAKE